MTEVTNNLKQDILTYIQENKDVEVNDISKALEMDSSTLFTTLVKAIAELERERQIQLTNKGTFIIKEKDQSNVQGQFSVDRKSTRLNSSHVSISYAVFC